MPIANVQPFPGAPTIPVPFPPGMPPPPGTVSVQPDPFQAAAQVASVIIPQIAPMAASMAPVQFTNPNNPNAAGAIANAAVVTPATFNAAMQNLQGQINQLAANQNSNILGGEGGGGLFGGGGGGDSDLLLLLLLGGGLTGTTTTSTLSPLVLLLLLGGGNGFGGGGGDDDLLLLLAITGGL